MPPAKKSDNQIKQDNIKEVAETLEKQGFVVVDDNELEESWKTYHILREA